MTRDRCGSGPSELVGIDDALRDELGFSLDTLRFVLGVAWAGAWDITPEQPFITTSVGGLHRQRGQPSYRRPPVRSVWKLYDGCP